MQDQVITAAVAFDAQPAAPAANLERIAGWCRRAGQAGAHLVLFPELSISGFLPNHPPGDHAAWLAAALRIAWQTAEPLDGPSARELARISKETGTFAAAGFLENAGNRLFNTHLLAGEGRILGYWRKMHIPLFEMPIYNGGGPATVVETALGRIGVNICFDAFMPESTRMLGVGRAEIALFPFAADPPPATPAAWGAWAKPVVQARCTENGLFGVACNYFGEAEAAGVRQRFPGGALTVCPGGAVVAECLDTRGEPHMLLSTLRLDALLEARAQFEYTFRFRRPELYRILADFSENE